MVARIVNITRLLPFFWQRFASLQRVWQASCAAWATITIW